MDAAYGGGAGNAVIERIVAACLVCDWKSFGVIANACFVFGTIGKRLHTG